LKRIFIGALIFIAGVLIVTLSNLSGGKEAKGSVRYIGLKVYDPVYVAKDKGFFEKRGVSVEITDTVAGGPTALQAVGGGNAESCVSSVMAIINARAQGLPVIGVSDLQSAIKVQALEEFFVLDDSADNRPITSVADLRGKKIAINLVKSSFHYTWLMALDKAGLSGEDVEFVILPFDQQELALINGQVDAIGLMQPYILHAKEQPNVRLLFDALDIFGEKQFSMHVVNSVWADNNKAQAEGFVTAIAEAAAWIENNQAEAKQVISKYTGVDVKYIEDYYYQENCAVIMGDAQYWLDYMRGNGDLANDWLSVSDFATNRFNLKVGN